MAIGLLIIVLVAIVLVVIGVAVYLVSIYNGLIKLNNNIKKSWSNINVLLKQRADELPKLVKSVKGYMKHERGTLKELTKARTSFLKAKTMSQKAAADSVITSALKTIFAVAENYPKLRATENFQQLQNRISGIENELADRREFYNDSVYRFNVRIQSFPDMYVAGWLNYKPKKMFKVSEADKKDVEINF